MRLSTKTSYGTRALLDLAIHSDRNAPVPLKDISERQGISLHYLEHIIAPLVASGIIHTIRGAKGGIALSRPAKDISIKELVEILEGSTSLVECVTRPQSCSRSGSCAAQDIWDEVRLAIDHVLGSTTLQDLVERQTRKNSTADMYFI